MILVAVPNDYSIIQMYSTSHGHVDRNFWFSPPDHLYHFNAENICSFVENLGYTVMDVFSSFPVDMFLLHPDSNYVKNRAKGKAAHHARIALDLLIAEAGCENLLNLYRSMAKCGIGRDVTIVIKLKKEA